MTAVCTTRCTTTSFYVLVSLKEIFRIKVKNSKISSFTTLIISLEYLDRISPYITQLAMN